MVDLLSWDGAGYNMAMRELRHRQSYTPDLRKLLEHEYHLVFIYNNLKKDYDDHSFFLKHSKYLGEAQSAAEHFVMKRNSTDAMLFREDKAVSKKAIVGELYACPVGDIMSLDSFFAHGTLFERTRDYFIAREQVAPMKQALRRPVVDAIYYRAIDEAWENHDLRFTTMNLAHGRPSWVFNQKEAFAS